MLTLRIHQNPSDNVVFQPVEGGYERIPKPTLELNFTDTQITALVEAMKRHPPGIDQILEIDFPNQKLFLTTR